MVLVLMTPVAGLLAPPPEAQACDWPSSYDAVHDICAPGSHSTTQICYFNPNTGETLCRGTTMSPPTGVGR